MTLDISRFSNKEKFINDFYKINNKILIHGEDIENINTNISIKEKEFFNEISDEVIVDVESF